MRNPHLHVFAFTLSALLATHAAAQNLGGWLEPDDGWDYVFEANEGEDVDGEWDFDFAGGQSLDGTWMHSNGSDAWDGSGPGDEFRPDGVTPAAPGGAGIVLVDGAGEEGGVAEVLSIVDIGDPRGQGFGDPSNRKTWFCHDTAFDAVDANMSLQTGLTLIVRSRLHPDVDPDAPGHQLPDGGVDDDAGQGVAPGYTIRDGGKGGHGFYDTVLDRNFTLVPHGTSGYQLPPQVGEGLPPANFLDVGDNQVFHSIWITITDEDANDRYTVTIWLDGAVEPAAIYEDIQLGDDTDCDGLTHLHMGFHSTPQKGAVQIDYFGYKIGAFEPESFCPGGLSANFDAESGEVSLSWSPGEVDSYTLLENGSEIQSGIDPATTSVTIASPARPTATYELTAVGRECNTLSTTVTTVVCPELSCSADAASGEVTLSWTDPGFLTPTGFTILRDGAEIGNVGGDVRSFTDTPGPGEYTYELGTASDPADSCPSNPFCNVRLFSGGAVNITGDVWDQVVFNGLARKVVTDDGVASLYFPGGPKDAGDTAAFALDVTALGDGETKEGRFLVEIQARYDNDLRIINRAFDPASSVHLALSRTGQSVATDDLGAQEVVEQVPSPPGPPTVDSASSTLVRTKTVGIELSEGLNLFEVQAADIGGTAHSDQVQIFELRIAPFAPGLEASLVPFPCPSGLGCARRPDGSIQLTWTSGDPHEYEITRDGEVIASLPMGEMTSFVDTPGDGFFEYTLTAVDDDSCPSLSCGAGGGVPDENGYIREWLVLGPLDYGCVTSGLGVNCATPGVAAIETDHLAGTVDGSPVSELDIEPFEGMEVTLGAETGVKPAPNGELNPGAPGAATWFFYQSPNPGVDYNVVFGGDPGNDYMVYAVTYVNNTSGDTILTNLEVASDDSVQVLVNDDSVHTNNIARGLDIFTPDFVPGVELLPGLNRVLVKVYEGGGGTGLALRFIDDIGIPLTDFDGIHICVDPGCAEMTPEGTEYVRGDTNVDDLVNISDGIHVLNVLFLGIGLFECEAAADTNEDGQVNLSDGIQIFNALFLGTGVIAPPNACGEGVAAEGTCESYPFCE